MKKLKLTKTKALETLPYALVFLAGFRFPIDSDIGWHLKHGEYFLLKGRILDINTLSSDMAGFQYINHSWLFDNFTYIIFKFWGFIGLSIASSIFFVLIFYFISKISKISLWQKLILFPLFIFLELENLKFSYSAQNLSVLFTLILFYLLGELGKGKPKIILPLIFGLLALWTNIHGQFASGLALITVFIFTYFVQKFFKKEPFERKKDLSTILVLPLAFLATLINPYGIRIYELVFKHLFNPVLSSYIFEWQSPLHFGYLKIVLAVLIIISLCSVFVLAYKKILLRNLFIIFAAILFIIPSFSANRYLWVAIAMSAPLMAIALKEFKPNETIAQRVGLSIALVLYFFLGFVNFPYKSFIYPTWKTYCVFQQCSDEAAKAIVKDNLNNNLFTVYELGGWLIWNYPQIKPYSDGRMTVWEENRNGTTYKATERSINIAYAKIKIEDTDFKNVFIIKSLPIYDEMEDLTNQGKWSKVFEDLNTAVYTKR